MANTIQIITGQSFQTASAGATWYYPYGSLANYASSSETDVKFKTRIAGTISLLGVRVTTNGASSTSDFYLRVNGANGNCHIALSASTTGLFEDTSGSDTVAAGDDLAYSLTRNAGANTTAFTSIRSVFTGNSSATIQNFSCRQEDISNSTQYRPISGYAKNNLTTEADVQQKIRAAGTFSKAGMRVSYDASSAQKDWTFRINSGNGNIVVHCTGGTGYFEDTTHSDAVVAGDLVNWKMDSVSNGGIEVQSIIQFTSSDTKSDMFANYPISDANTQTGSGATDDWPVSGMLYSSSTNARITMGVQKKFTNMRCYVQSNGASGAGTLSFRKNGSNVNQTVSITAATTGWFEDTTHNDVIGATDDVCIRLTGGTGGTTVTYSLGITVDEGSTAWQQECTATVTLTATALKGDSRTLSQTVTLTATFLGVRIQSKLLSEIVTVTASMLRTISRTLSQTVSLTASMLRNSTRILSETVSLTATFSYIKAKFGEFMDTVSISDVIRRIEQRILTQTLTLTATFSGFRLRIATLTETTTITASMLRTVNRVFSEVLSLTATLRKVTSRTLSQTVTLTATALKMGNKILSQTVTLTASLLRVQGRTLSEIVNLADQLIVRLNGIVTNLWSKVARTLDTWTKQDHD